MNDLRFRCPLCPTECNCTEGCDAAFDLTGALGHWRWHVEQLPAVCASGCGCRWGTDDPDANECACDGVCCMVTMFDDPRMSPAFTLTLIDQLEALLVDVPGCGPGCDLGEDCAYTQDSGYVRRAVVAVAVAAGFEVVE